MTVLWLFVWLIQDTPAVHAWNEWLVSLLVCGFLDLLGVLRKGAS